MRLPSIGESRDALLALPPGDLTVIFLPGNIGDHLIHAGLRRLLSELPYESITDVRRIGSVSGQTAILSGCGGWCRWYHDAPTWLAATERRFEQVVVFPSSFHDFGPVTDALSSSKARFFARERPSFECASGLCDITLAHDTAFFADFEPYRGEGEGTLRAYRDDREGYGYGGTDISSRCGDLDQWLRLIASYEEIHTDRAHVMLAAALLGKRVRWNEGRYHKLRGISEFLTDYDVRPL